MNPLDDPFVCLEAELAKHRLGSSVDAAIFDIHGEASSEKQALGLVADGRVSLAVGSHTHVPTADGRILPKGTAYQTDAGMCGDYDSVIGNEKAVAIKRFTSKLPTARLSPASGEGALCGVFVETDDASGLAKRIEPIRLGGGLMEVMPAA